MVGRLFGEKIPRFSEVHKEEIYVKTDARLLDWIRNNEIGSDSVIETPFGNRNICYCDYTGSARSLLDFENYIKSEVLPLYGNTHSSITVTSEQSTLFLQEARDVVRNAVGAGEQDAVLFTGNGATAAVELLIHLLGLSEIIVIHGIQEHHSNLLPWIELCKESFFIKESVNGKIDVDDLNGTVKAVKEKYGSDVPILGCFTATSNITGIVMNIEEVNAVLVKWQCISIWDYASAAPYIEINMNRETPKSAIFFSGHKFIGGVQTPGVLVIKKHLIRSKCPKRIGGGTVSFVSATSRSYLKNVEYREEGGTSDVVGAVRLALAFKLKATVGHELIVACEEDISRRDCVPQRVIDFLSKCENVVLLGSPRATSRLAVFSFLIRDSISGLFYHHNYISALLNDLFGIQSRSGCACAGPYAQYLLGINEELALSYYSFLKEDDRLDRNHLRRQGEYSEKEMLRPGFTRISIPFFASLSMVDFVLEAIAFVGKNARRFMTQYRLNCETAEWHHVRQRVFTSRKWLGFVAFAPSGLKVRKSQPVIGQTPSKLDTHALIAVAEQLALEAENAKTTVADGRIVLDKESEKLRWFLMSSEVDEAKSGINVTYCKAPFEPRKYIVTESNETLESTALFLCSNKYVLTDQHADENELISEERFCSTLEEVASISNAFTEAREFSCDAFLSHEAGNRSSNDSKISFHNSCSCSVSTVTAKNDWMSDEWNKRVVVKQRENLSEAEKKSQPWVRPPADLYKKAVLAIQSFNMIQNGDRVLVCLSGGKDSLSLLHILHLYQERARQHRKSDFRLGAITVDPCSSGYNPRPLIEYCRTLNIDYFYEEQDIIGEAAKLSKCRSICGYCSRMKRGRLTSAAKLHGYNVLAMGHHLDDLAETFLMSAFQNGSISTMKAHYTIRKYDLRIIRPLIYIREKSLREFAEKNALPVIAENCPACFEQPKERHRLKQVLASYELIYPQLFASLRSALHPLMMVDSAETSGMRRMAIENIIKTFRDRENKN